MIFLVRDIENLLLILGETLFIVPEIYVQFNSESSN
jgi:hypothetical protein